MGHVTTPWRSWARRSAGQLLGRTLRRYGYAKLPTASAGPPGPPPLPIDFDAETAETVTAVAPYTVTSPERVQALCEAVRYLVRASVPGAFVECGVWRGGSALAIVRTLRSLGVDDRDVYLFDTFDAFPLPGDEDVDVHGTPAIRYHELNDALRPSGQSWDNFPADRTRDLLEATGYPGERLHLIAGLVEETVPNEAPEDIALLRLDTDYYGSTKHELKHLFPRVAPGGVLILDDYGHFVGCRKATDEYVDELASQGAHLLLQRIDYAGRLAVVPPLTTD